MLVVIPGGSICAVTMRIAREEGYRRFSSSLISHGQGYSRTLQALSTMSDNFVQLNAFVFADLQSDDERSSE